MTRVLAVPYHLDQRLAAFAPGLPADREVTAELPDAGPWERMAVLYEQVARAVAAEASPPLVVSGDCTTALGVLAGLQRGGAAPAVVWLDAHADFHTEESSTSGYLGGMPLALAAGVGTPALPRALGLRPVPVARVRLVDARDTDPGEHALLAEHGLARTPLEEVGGALPDGPLHLHVDVDVCDPPELPGLLFPVPAGRPVPAVLAAVRQVLATGRVAALSVGATWSHEAPAPAGQALVRQLHAALQAVQLE